MRPLCRLALTLSVYACLVTAAFASSGGGHALIELMDLLRAKGVLTDLEHSRISQIIEDEARELTERTRNLDARAKELHVLEQELREREADLDARIRATGTQESPEVTPTPITDHALSPWATEKQEVPPGSPEAPVRRGGYEKGLGLFASSTDSFSLYLGGLLQTDARSYDTHSLESRRTKFDVRRARLLAHGNAFHRLSYRLALEFQGADARRLLDAYVDMAALPYVILRAGQFKEPFGLEQSGEDAHIFFAERSMGYYLTPRRDVGFMAHASLCDDRMTYAAGLFTGDGMDDSASGYVSDPEWTGRLTGSPFKKASTKWLRGLHLGGSLSYARIDRTNVNLQIKTAGLTTFFDVASSAKFNVIRDAGRRIRTGAELAWAYGPLLLFSEYTRIRFEDIQTSSTQFDFRVEDAYLALVWFITGEEPGYERGVFRPVRPLRSLWDGGWGGWSLGLRYDTCSADSGVYDSLIQEGYSVRKASAYTVALNWRLDPHSRLILDATRTDFDKPLLVSRDPLTGSAIFSDREDVFTARFQFQF